MEQNSTPQINVDENEEKGFIVWLTHTANGFIFSCFSPSFYKSSIKKGVGSAIGFFFIFALAITIVQTYSTFRGLRLAGEEIQSAFELGEFPEILIKDGIAYVDGKQPILYEDKRSFFAIDTTGVMNEIDTNSYSEGILLTRTEMHVISDNGHEVFLLTDLNEIFGNPIVIDKTQSLSLWKTISAWIGFFVFIAVFIWNSVIRLAYIMLVGLLVWGIVSISRKGIDFSKILIAGLYALVPTVYLLSVLKIVNISFFGLFTVLLVAIWGFMLSTVLKSDNSSETEIR